MIYDRHSPKADCEFGSARMELNVPVTVVFTSKERKEPGLNMPSPEPKDNETADQDKVNKPEGEKHLDRDGGERQPTDQSSEK